MTRTNVCSMYLCSLISWLDEFIPMQKVKRVPAYGINFLPSLILCCGFVLLAGCGGEKDWGFVEGTVKVNGEVFGPGLISFKPQDSKARGGGIGEINAEGRFMVRSSGKKEGLAAGEYLIAISEKMIEGDEEAVKEKPRNKIPAKYRRTSTSGLTRTVKPESQTFDFDLE